MLQIIQTAYKNIKEATEHVEKKLEMIKRQLKVERERIYIAIVDMKKAKI